MIEFDSDYRLSNVRVRVINWPNDHLLFHFWSHVMSVSAALSDQEVHSNSNNGQDCIDKVICFQAAGVEVVGVGNFGHDCCEGIGHRPSKEEVDGLKQGANLERSFFIGEAIHGWIHQYLLQIYQQE